MLKFKNSKADCGHRITYACFSDEFVIRVAHFDTFSDFLLTINGALSE